MKKYQLNGEIADFEYHSNFFDVCSPKSLKAFLAQLEDGEKAEIEINSPGGLVIYGVEMANAIKNSKAHVIAHVTGMAASMASVVACACDEIVMEEASFMMIHDPWGWTEGNADEMRKEAAILDQMKEICIGFYLSKFARTREELAALMREETWMTGNECLASGLKCSVVKSDLMAAASVRRNHFDKMPEAARTHLRVIELTEDQLQAVEAARQQQKEQAATAPAAPAPEAAVDWEARFKGASKKINELQAVIQSNAADYKTISDQLDQSRKDLDQAKAEIEQLKAKAGETAQTLAAKEKDLADARDSLAKTESEVKRLKDNRQLLTAGVLVQAESFEDKLKAANSPEEREAIRAQRRKSAK